MCGRVLVLAGLSALAAGCGGGGKAPVVASLAATASTATAAKPSFEAFSRCMTAHGVRTTSPGGHGVTMEDASAAQARAAMQACRQLMPGGGPPQLSPAQEARRQSRLTVFSACMRKNGVSNFPDPAPAGELPFGGLADVNTGAPLFKAAFETCRPLFPKIGPQIRLGP